MNKTLDIRETHKGIPLTAKIINELLKAEFDKDPENIPTELWVDEEQRQQINSFSKFTGPTKPIHVFQNSFGRLQIKTVEK